MTGFNEKLQKCDKVQCLYCLSNKEPEISYDKIICSDCKTVLQAYLNIKISDTEIDLTKNQYS